MFKKEIRGEIEIMASPQKVWKALTDFEAFTDWNPFIPCTRSILRVF